MLTIDRQSRDRLAAEVRRFINGGSTAFEFDDAIFDIESKDLTVVEIARRLWCFYDDFIDHSVSLSRTEWNYFQRLLLILESDRHIKSTHQWQWQRSQLPAIVALAGFIPVVLQFGFGEHLIAFSIPFGLVSMLIAFWRRREAVADDEPQEVLLALSPFESYSELSDTYFSVDGFQKQAYRRELADVRIRSTALEWINLIPVCFAWLMFAPFVLTFQSLPRRNCTTKVGVCS